MGDFGTGLRAHLEHVRKPVRVDGAAPPPELDPRLEALDDERRRLDVRAAELAARELELAEREADLERARQRLAVELANALIAAAESAGVPPPIDELAVARARRGA